MIIYAVAQEYQDQDNYCRVSNPVSAWYITKEEAGAIRDHKNEPKVKELEKENEWARVKTVKENAEYEALVTAGLRQPREPRKPWINSGLREAYVVIDDELIVDLDQLIKILGDQEYEE